MDAGLVAAEVLAALDAGRQVSLVSDRVDGFTPEAAREVTAALRQLRTARGETPVGRKIGFTNRGIWDEYKVHRPIWGDMYATTVHDIVAGETIVVSGLPEPRIEPELVVGLRSGLESAAPGHVADAIGWVAHGFEIVQSVFAGWRFRAADCIADGGLHGALFIGPRVGVTDAMRPALAAALAAVRVELRRDGEVVDTGIGANALDGPLSALAHLVDVLADDPFNGPLRAGEMVTTGTLTRAFPVAAGETWETRVEGLGLSGLSVRIA